MATKSNIPTSEPAYHHSELVKWHLHELDPQNQEERPLPEIAQELELAHANLVGILSAALKIKGRDKETKYRARHILSSGAAVTAVWPKQNIIIDFGLYQYEFYLSWDITHFKHLFRARDEFWHHLSSLSSLGKLRLMESESPKPIISNHMNSTITINNSVVARFFHNMLAFAIDDNNTPDFGSIEVAWPIDHPFEKLFDDISNVAYRLHQMAYHLYRVEYQIEHAKNKRSVPTRAT
ncbi:MAG TPA: hypothetical protein VJ508_09815 [Saprospiraceae bacterium]|nr:hypothetical protein [Saprospiraceae bacterium]